MAEDPRGSDPVSPADEPERRMTARERRAERVRKGERKKLPAKALKNAALVVVVVLVLAGAVYGVNKLNTLAPSCALQSSHEHATFYIYDNGELLHFKHPKFNMQGSGVGVLPGKMHMHQPVDDQLHLEFGCGPFGQFFDYTGMELRPGYLKLDEELHGGKVLQDQGNQTLKMYLFEPDMDNVPLGNWTLKPDLHKHQLRDCERALITYGNQTDQQIEQQRAATRPPTDSSGCSRTT